MKVDVKVDVLIPTYRHFNSNAYHAIVAMVNKTREYGHSVAVPALFSGGVVQWARNDALKKVRKSAEYVLLVDDDMCPEADALERLLLHDRPAISALTTTRSLPVHLNVKAYDRNRDLFVPVDAVKPDTVLSGDFGVGTGFLLLRADTIKSVKAMYLSARDWAMDHAVMFSRMGYDASIPGVEREHVAHVRQLAFQQSGYLPLFGFHRDHERQRELGEDISLCRRLLQLGIPVAVDTGVQVGHVGDHTYGPWDLEYDTIPAAGTGTGESPMEAERNQLPAAAV